jgi:pyruvate dehydrogenase E1 component alpha subunit
MAAHTTSDDPTKYRVSAEVEIWKLRDPIARYRRWLTSEGIADADFFDAVDREADELGEHVRSATVSMADPDVSDIFDQVYVEPHRQVQDDKAAFTAYNSSFETAQGA